MWCLVAAALFGAAAPLTKPLLERASPLMIAGLLYLGGALGVAPLALRSLRSRQRFSRRNVLFLAGATLSGGLLAPILLLFALQAAAAASVSLWLALEPVATAILAFVIFRESIQPRIWIALGLVMSASILLVGAEKSSVFPALLASAACALWGLDNNLVARIDDLSPAVITFAKSLVAGTTNLAIAWLVIGVRPEAGVALQAMLIGVFAYGLSIWLFVAGAQQIGAVRAQVAFATAPFLGAVLSWWLVAQSPTPMMLLAGVLMAIGAYLAATARHEHEHLHEAAVHAHLHRHDDGHHAHSHAPNDEPARESAWHFHEHAHEAQRHGHAHVTDIHHAHAHGPDHVHD